MKFNVWLDSGANIHSCYKTSITLDDFGLTKEEFEGMTESEKEDMFREFAFQTLDWGWSDASEE